MLDNTVKFDGYLEKPLNREELAAEMTRLFNHGD